MSKHRILIDGYYLASSSGYGRFAFELCRALGTQNSDFQFIVAVPASIGEEKAVPYEHLSYVRMNDRVFPLWEQFTIPACARKNQCSLIHFPYNTRALWSGRSKTITTVHDLIFLNSHTERDAKSWLIHLYMAAAFYGGTVRSDAIVAVSDTTREALAEKHVTSRRIYNTVDGFIGSFSRSKKTVRPQRPYFLHRGSYAAGHRNTDRIIQAFLSRPQLIEQFDLKIFGVPDGAAHWKTTACQPVKYLQRVSDEKLASLYAGSRGVVAASLLEGFCLPIIEAFGFESPVITSRLNPMMEIAGDAALLVSADSTDEIADAMLLIGQDDRLAQQLIEKGRNRLKEFSSNNFAAQLIQAYEDVLRTR